MNDTKIQALIIASIILSLAVVAAVVPDISVNAVPLRMSASLIRSLLNDNEACSFYTALPKLLY